MHSIEQQAVETFKKNLLYFAEKQEKIYEKINILTQAIENGSYKEKYSLEYVNNSFDVLHIESGQYLYNKNSEGYTDILVKKVNYKKSDSVIESFYNQNITEEHVKFYDGKVPANDPLFAAAKIIHYANSVTSKNDEMKNIAKFIFCGVGLGLHINKIVDKIKASHLFIIEDNLELFRLSMFTTDYQALSERAELVFSVMDNDSDFQKAFNSFFSKGYNHNHYLKYSLFSQNDIAKIKRIQNFIVISPYLTYPYTSHIRELLKAPEYLIQNYPFLDVSKIHSNSPMESLPILLIASGPSLENNAKWLQENQNKFFIISVLSSLKTLNRLNVKPDIVINMDASTASPRNIEGVDVDSFLDRTLFILSSVVTRKLIDSFPKEKVYCFETASRYKQNFGTLTAPSIGETSYALSLILGAKELYLLGLDLALDPETKRSHSKEHHDSRVLEEEAQNDQYTELGKTVSYTKGNFIDQVPTLPVFALSVLALNAFSKKYLVNNQKVFNLNNGAFLEGAIPMHPENVDTASLAVLDKKSTINTIKSYFDSISENSLNELDRDFLDRQIEEAQRILNYTHEFRESTPTSNYDAYMQKFYLLSKEMVNLAHKETNDINVILYYYQFYIGSYIFDMFNTKGLKNNKRHLKKIHLIFTEQLIKILDLYITTLLVYKKFAED